MEAYLDNSATTRVSDDVKNIMVKVMTEDYGNPSSLHMKGVEAERYIKQSREIIARTLKVSEKEILFTSGGTESNNTALIGTAMANKRKGNHIITSMIEHASVSNPVKYLEKQGFRITWLPVDRQGRVNPDDVKEAICDDTILISVMYVNNEIGSVQPIDEIAQIIEQSKKDIIFHVDAIQAYGKIHIYPKRQKIDLMSVSGHKIHGPKGTGFLYIKDKTKINPIIFGGGQEKGMRSGTENVPGIAGLGVACRNADKAIDDKIEKMYGLKDYFIQKISKIEGTQVNSLNGHDSAPHIVSVSFSGVRSEVLLHSLEDRQIYVSAGSACSSNKPAVSATLTGIGLDKELLDSTLRFSFSTDTTKEQLDYTVDVIDELLGKLRMYIRS